MSRTLALVPCTAPTQAAVVVAIPDRWQTRFSMVRSAVSRPRVSARTVRTGSPACSRAPSSTLCTTS